MGKKRKTAILITTLCVLITALALAWALVWAPMRQRMVYPLKYEEAIAAAAREFDVHPCLIAAQIYCESSFREDAVSSVGAVGFLQIMPDTGAWIAKKLDIKDFQEEMLLDPAVNIRMGSWYLRFLLDRYGGRIQEALTAYNAGQGTVDKWLSDPALSNDGKSLDEIPGKDAKEYASKVVRAYEIYLEMYGDRLDPDHAFVGLR